MRPPPSQALYTADGTNGTQDHPEEYYRCGDEGLGCAGVATLPFLALLLIRLFDS